jgi:hypothetical protein
LAWIVDPRNARGSANVLLGAAIGLIIATVVATALLVALDMRGRAAGEWYHAIRDWQQLLGAVLGFLGAAGVLVLSNEIQINQERERTLQHAHAIGLGLALEAERIYGGIGSGLAIAEQIKAAPAPDYSSLCTQYVRTLRDIVPREKPVWTAVLDQMVDFGDDNLALFVRFYGLFDDFVLEVQSFDNLWCVRDGENQIADLERRLRSALEFYRIIASRFGTALVEPEPAIPPASEPPPAPPADTAPPAETTPPAAPAAT